jgi:hypothetical protein
MNIVLLALCRTLAADQRAEVIKRYDELADLFLGALPAEGAPTDFVDEMRDYIAEQRKVLSNS